MKQEQIDRTDSVARYIFKTETIANQLYDAIEAIKAVEIGSELTPSNWSRLCAPLDIRLSLPMKTFAISAGTARIAESLSCSKQGEAKDAD